MMDSPFEYRSYMIASEDGWFIAKPMDGESGEIGSRHLLRLMRAIDALWAAVETDTMPQWFSTEDLIVLDQPVRDRLKLGPALKILPARIAAAFETTPSEAYPLREWKTVVMILAAIGLAIPIALLANRYVAGLEPEIIFTLIVMGVALVYGAGHALIATAVFAAVFNFAFQPPDWQFSAPGADELTYIMINVVLSIVLPWLFGPRRPLSRKGSASARTRHTAWPYL